MNIFNKVTAKFVSRLSANLIRVGLLLPAIFISSVSFSAEPDFNKGNENIRSYLTSCLFSDDIVIKKNIKELNKGMYKNSQFAIYILSQCYSAANMSKESISELTKLIRINYKDFDDLYKLRGFEYERLRDWDNALSDYLKSMKSHPNNFKIYESLGNIYDKLNSQEDALKNYNHSLLLLKARRPCRDNKCSDSSVGEISMYKKILIILSKRNDVKEYKTVLEECSLRNSYKPIGCQ